MTVVVARMLVPDKFAGSVKKMMDKNCHIVAQSLVGRRVRMVAYTIYEDTPDVRFRSGPTPQLEHVEESSRRSR